MQSGAIAATGIMSTIRLFVKSMKRIGSSCLGDLQIRAAIAPAQQAPFDGFSAEEEHQNEAHDQKDQSHGERRVVGALSKLKKVSQAASCGNEFTDTGAGEGKSDGHLQAA